jgi:hypothetical protein
MSGRRRGGKRRRTQIEGAFAPRLIEMLDSPALRVTSQSGLRILHRVEIELGRHGGTENGKLKVTYNDFVKYGVDRHCIGPGIREMVALGFLEITEQGRAGNAEYRAPNVFRLTYRHTDDAQPTHEWRRIKTLEEAQEIARAARNQPSAKTNSQWGNLPVSVGETPTEIAESPVGENPTTVIVGNPPLLSISAVGSAADDAPPPPPQHDQHDGNSATTIATDPPSTRTTSRKKGRAKKSTRPRAAKSTPTRKRGR